MSSDHKSPTILRLQALIRVSLPMKLEPGKKRNPRLCPCPKCLEKVEAGMDSPTFLRQLIRQGAEVEEVSPWPMGLGGSVENDPSGEPCPMPINHFLEAFLRVLSALVAEWELKVDSEMGSKQLRALEPTLRALLKVIGTLEGVTSTRKLLEEDPQAETGASPLLLQLLRKFPGVKALNLSSPEQAREVLKQAPTEVLRSVAVTLQAVSEEEAKTMDHSTLLDRLFAGPKTPCNHDLN